LPYLAGERAPVWNPRALGVMQNLSLSTGRGEFARAVVEGVCFAIRDVITVMEEAGAEISGLCTTGSASGSAVLNQAKADILGREIAIPVYKEAELLGLAIAGTVALGAYKSVYEACSALVRIENRIQPDGKKAQRYAELFGQYLEMKSHALTA
ncbi:MAG: FGGY-family carbohydrate kinase, partial [Treponema sp.]|nr:FGGY-family carbohydrate kinase [Treponema sp.]